MDVCRLCLDLVATQGEAKLLDGETRDMVQVVAPELNLEASKEPRACAECQRTLAHLFEFKSRVFEREGEVRSAVGPRCGQLSLKEALEGGAPAATNPGGGDGSTPAKAKDRVCRTCLTPIECESFTVLRPSEPDAYLSSMLDVCLVEVDLELTRDPVMCETCLEQLQRLHHFRSTCQDVEEKIVEFREGDGSAMDHVDLHAVLGAATPATPDVEMVTVKEEDEEGASSSGVVHRRGGRKRVRVEPVKAEPVKEEEEEDDESEEEDDEDEDMSEGEEDLDKALKQEELDIKSETGTSDSDNTSNNPISHNSDAKDGNEREYKCPRCKYQTCKKSLLELHIHHHKNKFSMCCDKCPFETKSEIAFKSHQVKIHRETMIPLCSKWDHSSPASFEHHEQQHICKHKDNLTCELCSYFCETKKTLTQHTHEKQCTKELFKCPQCPYKSCCIEAIARHVEMHTEKQFECEKCPFKCNGLPEFMKHQVDQHGYEPPFKCSKCDFRSYMERLVKSHEKNVHQGESEFVRKAPMMFKKFKCPVCPYVSSHISNIKRHMDVHKVRRSDCNKCPFKGNTRQGLVKHQVDNHNYQLPFKCSKCDFRSFEKQYLQRHEKSKHRDKP